MSAEPSLEAAIQPSGFLPFHGGIAVTNAVTIGLVCVTHSVSEVF